MQAAIAIIGGSGMYTIDGVTVFDEATLDTPFGAPSGAITIAEVAGKRVLFLPRHGKGHRHLPTEIPAKANMWALKSLGAKFVVGISSVGSLKEEIAPCDFIVPSQIIDRTKTRDCSFFGSGIVGHVSFADPFCPYLQDVLASVLKEEGLPFHTDETYVCMEGPLFSTRAESKLYRSWGAGVIGMTAIPEAMLAREAELSYALVAMATDYDAWRESEETVTIQMVIENANANAENVKRLIPKIVRAIDETKITNAHSAARYAAMTAREAFPEETMNRLNLFYGKYWNS